MSRNISKQLAARLYGSLAQTPNLVGSCVPVLLRDPNFDPGTDDQHVREVN
jgi:hypothetical protein